LFASGAIAASPGQAANDAMLNIPTVFVLGAGASVPYDFPTGFQLSQRVFEQLADGREGYQALTVHCSFTPKEIEDFRQSFYHSGKPSIDAFLEHRTDLIQIGKAATAQALIRYEDDHRLFVFDANQNWLRELSGRLASSFDEFGQNTIAFVTFNYDRSVEHYIFTTLKNTFKKTDAEVAAVLGAIPVIHLHGRLGYLPWQKGETRAYHTDVTTQAMKVCVDSIKIIHESITDGRDDDFKAAKKLLADAHQVVIMGLGYNTINLERLGIPDLDPGKTIGTCMGLGFKGRADAMKNCNSKVQLVDGGCMHVVRELVRWA